MKFSREPLWAIATIAVIGLSYLAYQLITRKPDAHDFTIKTCETIPVKTFNNGSPLDIHGTYDYLRMNNVIANSDTITYINGTTGGFPLPVEDEIFNQIAELIQILPNGSLNTNFSTNGRITIENPFNSQNKSKYYGNDVQLKSNGNAIWLTHVTGLQDFKRVWEIDLNGNRVRANNLTYQDVIWPLTGVTRFFGKIKLDSDENLIISGQNEHGFWLTKLLSDTGLVDENFGRNINGVQGYNYYPIEGLHKITDLVLDDFNRIYIAGIIDSTFTGNGKDNIGFHIFRFDETGKIDSTFNSDGHIKLDNELARPNQDIRIHELMARPNEIIRRHSSKYDRANLAFLNEGVLASTTDKIFKLTESGQLDYGFAQNGVINISNIEQSPYILQDLVVTPNNNILVCGFTISIGSPCSVMAFGENGDRISGFGGPNTYAFSFPTSVYNLNSISLVPDNTVLVAGQNFIKDNQNKEKSVCTILQLEFNDQCRP